MVSQQCLTCSRTFARSPAHASMFCSVRCHRASITTQTPRVCAVCGGAFMGSASAIARGHATTCSRPCARVFISRKPRKAVERVCHACGTTFLVTRRYSSPRVYCTQACFLAYKRGDRCGNWKGGVTLDRRAYSVMAGEARRARMLGATVGGGVSSAAWKAICERYGHRCPRCGEVKPLTMDHITPLVKGGAHHPSNIQPLCGPCNSAKHTRLISYAPDGSSVEIVDVMALLTSIVNGSLPLDLIGMNYRVLNRRAAEQGPVFSVTGFESIEVRL